MNTIGEIINETFPPASKSILKGSYINIIEDSKDQVGYDLYAMIDILGEKSILEADYRKKSNFPRGGSEKLPICYWVV